MTRKEIYEKLNEVFKEVFDNQAIAINDETTAKDIDGWDSLMHISLIASIEDTFDFKFKMKDIIEMKKIGDMVDIIEERIE